MRKFVHKKKQSVAQAAAVVTAAIATSGPTATAKQGDMPALAKIE